MKKYLFTMSAIAMLFATSCQNDLDIPTAVGGEATVSFNVATPEIGTRAFGDGTTATVLQYAVYDAQGNILDGFTTTNDQFTGSDNIQLQLTTGNTYSVAFWAAAPENPYDVDLAGRKMTVDYDGVKSNNENLDAFYAYYTFTVTGAQQESIVLKRPFAQLNIATADLAASKKAGYEVTQSYVKVPVYDTLDFVEGKVATQDTETFEWANIPTEKLIVNGNEYGYLAMDYLLVGADSELVEVEFGYRNAANDIKTRTVGSVPVQRNYRTNIYGNLLTSMVDVNISIDPIFDGNNEPAELFRAAAFGGSVTLEEDVVLDAPLKVQANMVLNLNGKTITTKEKEAGRHHYAIDNYANLVIEGEGAINARGVQNFGTMTIDGKVTITNVDTNGGSAIWNEGKLTINDGTFTTNDQAGAGSYGSALNTQEGGEAIINGGNFITNSQLTYAILNYGTTTINYAVVKGKHGAVASDNIAKTTIYGGSFELMENPGVSDHCAYLVTDIRGGKFTLGKNTDSGAQVFYGSTIAEGYISLADGDWFEVVAGTRATGETELKDALKDVNADVVSISENVNISGSSAPWLNIGREVEVTTEGNTLTVGNSANYGLFCDAGSDVTFRDANVVSAGGAIVARDGAQVAIESGSYAINSSSTSQRHLIYAFGTGTVVTINEGTFSFEQYRQRTYGCVLDGAVLYINGGTFGVAPNHDRWKFPFYVDGGQIIIKGGTFGFDPTEWVAAGYKTVKNDSTWTVVAE